MFQGILVRMFQDILVIWFIVVVGLILLSFIRGLPVRRRYGWGTTPVMDMIMSAKNQFELVNVINYHTLVSVEENDFFLERILPYEENLDTDDWALIADNARIGSRLHQFADLRYHQGCLEDLSPQPRPV